jgi:hypothetical protein
MKVQVSRPLSALSIAATIAFAAFAATAQTTPMMRGEMKGEDMMKGGDMMGGDMARMTKMMSMMREKLSHAGSCRGAQGRSQDHRGANAGME